MEEKNSPDIDVCHISLTNVHLKNESSEVIVQLSADGRDLKLLHINRFITTMNSDSSLYMLPAESHPKYYIYIATRCDFSAERYLKKYFLFVC